MKILVKTNDGETTQFRATPDDINRWVRDRYVMVGDPTNGCVVIPFETVTRIDVMGPA